MKRENADILTFDSYRPKKEPVPANSGMEENAGLKESPEEISAKGSNMGENNTGENNMGEITNSLDLEGDSDLDTPMLTPDIDEELQAPLSDTLRKECSEDVSDLIPESESDILSGATEVIFKSDSLYKSASLSKASSLSETVSLPETASLPFPDLSLESEVLGRSGQEVIPFEAFAGYDDNALKSPPVSEAFGIVTTGIEPLELTPSGAVITGYITSARRDEIRLGTYVVVPYENGEKLFARVGKLQYRQEFVVDDATEIHSRRMLSARGNHVNEDYYKFLACLDPLCILYLKPGGTLTRRMADRIPHPNTPILPVTDRFEVQTGLNIPEEGIFLGHLSVGGELLKTHSEPETVAYYLRNDYSTGDPLIFRHMLICGSTGTGKTFLSKNILRQFLNESNRYRLRRSPDKARKNPCLVIM